MIGLDRSAKLPSGPFFPFCSPRFLMKLHNNKKGALFIPMLLGILVRELVCFLSLGLDRKASGLSTAWHPCSER